MSVFFHVDADSFFASVERALHPELRTIPVCVTSHYGGCILACTYDMKAKGITTGMPLWEAQKKMGQQKFHHSIAHFHAYARYATQLFTIFRTYTPQVEEYSIDEAFLEMTGFQIYHKCSYEELARRIQQHVARDLGLPVSIGISTTKILAKMASKKAKPKGVCVVTPEDMRSSPVGAIPGVGARTQKQLKRMGITMVGQFISLSEQEVERVFHKPGFVLWKEVQGVSLLSVEHEPELPKSVSRTRSFAPTTNSTFLEAQCIQHIVLCMEKLRLKGLLAGAMSLSLRDREYGVVYREYVFSEPHQSTQRAVDECISHVRLLSAGKSIRSLSVGFSHLVQKSTRPMSLFVCDEGLYRSEELCGVLDGINRKFGRGTVRSARLWDERPVDLRQPEYLPYPFLGTVKG